MENSSAILKCFQCLSTFCLYRLFCCLLRNIQNFSWIQKAVSTISQTLLPVLPVYSDCTRRTESSIETETKSQDRHVLCNCSSLHICTVLCEMKSLLLKVEIRLRRQCWRGLESCSFQPTQATPGVWGWFMGLCWGTWFREVCLVSIERARRSGCSSQLCPSPPVTVPSCAMFAASLKHDMPHLGQVLAPLRCAVQWEGAGR